MSQSLTPVTPAEITELIARHRAERARAEAERRAERERRLALAREQLPGKLPGELAAYASFGEGSFEGEDLLHVFYRVPGLALIRQRFLFQAGDWYAEDWPWQGHFFPYAVCPWEGAGVLFWHYALSVPEALDLAERHRHDGEVGDEVPTLITRRSRWARLVATLRWLVG